MSGVLCFFHFGSNTGYAIQNHEYVFAQVAYRLAGHWKDVHFAYPTLVNGRSSGIPKELTNFIEIDFASNNIDQLEKLQEYVRAREISTAIGFDQPVRRKAYRYMRKGGVDKLISYWGSSMSDLNRGIKLRLKRVEVSLTRYKPDLFVFQSHGMRKMAVGGRGIPFENTKVVRSGIDISLFSPNDRSLSSYAHDIFGIPPARKIVYYSGHMEERKGVRTIVKAAIRLVSDMGRNDLHFLFFGNRGDEETVYKDMYKNTKAEDHITFGGYRTDLAKILPDCHIGVIASTERDSFPLTSLEIGAAGLPLLVSDLIGVRETVVHGKTGFRFEVGNERELAKRISQLADDEPLSKLLGTYARQRVLHSFTRDKQIDRLEYAVRSISHKN